jgi:DNA-binding response OmpR family regulator
MTGSKQKLLNSMDKCDMPTSEPEQTKQTKQDTILIVSKDDEVCECLVDLFEEVGGYRTLRMASFEEGLASILIQPLSLVIIQIQLPDLSGIDLLAAVKALCPNLPVILIDDNLSAKSAVAAFRLGAIDYLGQPINYDFLLMRVDWELKYARTPQAPPPEPIVPRKDYSPQDRERRLNPETRSIGLMVKRAQFLHIAAELQSLQTRIQAKFVGLVDSDENLIGAAGTLEDWDLVLFRKALTVDHNASQHLLDVLGETSFHSTFYEGKHNSVYVTQFGQPHLVSLVVICPVDVKPGVAWFYSKQAAKAIDKILKTVGQS